MPKKKTTTTAEAKQTQEVPVQPTPVTQSKKLTRVSEGKIVFGVAAGIAEYFEIDPILIRLAFLILAGSGGSGVLIYLVLALVLPEKGSEQKTTKEVIEENAKDFEKTAKVFAANAETMSKSKNTQLWGGILVIILGIMLFISNLGFWDFGAVLSFMVRTLWPLFIIGLGVVILVKNQDDK